MRPERLVDAGQRFRAVFASGYSSAFSISFTVDALPRPHAPECPSSICTTVPTADWLHLPDFFPFQWLAPSLSPQIPRSSCLVPAFKHPLQLNVVRIAYVIPLHQRPLGSLTLHPKAESIVNPPHIIDKPTPGTYPFAIPFYNPVRDPKLFH